MAVPFSRPAYPGQRRVRRPTTTNNQQGSNPSDGHQTSFLRFLEGRGNLRLDQLSLTSRIAFYALYEAYRLLMDLTNQGNNQNHLTFEHRLSPPQPAQTSTNEQMEQVNLPDVVLSSTQSSTQQISTSPRAQVPFETSPRQLRPTTTSEENKWSHHHKLSEESLIPEIPEEDETDFGYSLMPDLLASNQVTREDLEVKLRSRKVSTSSDYFSLDGSQFSQDSFSEDPSESSLNSSHAGDFLDKTWSHHGDDILASKTFNWHNLGNQLCQIASAFEVTQNHAMFSEMNEEQRKCYQVYRELKLKTLALRRQDDSLSGLIKTICSQVLLSTIWILLKKAII